MRKAPTIQTHGRDPRKSKVPTTLPCPWTLSRMEGKLDGWSHQFLQNDYYASSTKMPPLFHVFLMAGSHIGSSHVMILSPAHPCTVFSQWACLIAPLLAEIKTLLLVRTQHEMHSGRVLSWGSRGFLVLSQGISMHPKLCLLHCFPDISEIRITALYLALHGLNIPLALGRVKERMKEVKPAMRNFRLQVFPQVPWSPKQRDNAGLSLRCLYQKIWPHRHGGNTFLIPALSRYRQIFL